MNQNIPMRSVILFLLLPLAIHANAQTNAPFDGSPWHVSTGNLSVGFAQASPVGAFPKTNFIEAPSSVESLVRLKNLGLVSFEDYVTWGAVERAPGEWSWQQHDAMEQAMHKAGLQYTVYTWLHFPPVWLRDQQTNNRTLMRCMEHGQDANYLSIFDPRTIKWYDHFYKNLHDHFGDKIDGVYACILGPYGEGNYPLRVDAFINMGHCHEGWWCGDAFAVKAFQTAMKQKYHFIQTLNQAWGTHQQSFAEVTTPHELSEKNFKPSPGEFFVAQDRRRWLDFMDWYNAALIDFTARSIQTVLKYFPAEKVRVKPGGSSGGINPITYGTYCPGYAKMAAPYHVVLQPADCMGAVFADKWVGTAYQFYGVKECTEPAGGLDERHFVQRMFSDASAGAAQLFTYEFENHINNLQKYVPLFTGKSGETEVAVFCPTTFYKLGGDVQPTIQAAGQLRDLCEFDVLDELLIADGALTTNRYKTLIVFQGEVVDQPILKKLKGFLDHGGRIIVPSERGIADLARNPWSENSRVIHIAPANGKVGDWRKQLTQLLAGSRGVDGALDGLWTCRRGDQVFIYNSHDTAAEKSIDGKTVTIEPHAIWFNHLAEK